MGLQLPASVAIADWCTAPEESIVSLLLEDTTIAKQLRSIHLYQFYSQGYTQDGAKEEDDLLERFARYYLACQGYNLFVPLLEFADTELGNASARIDHMMNYTLIVPSTKVLPIILLNYQCTCAYAIALRRTQLWSFRLCSQMGGTVCSTCR
jgi:hypothetical protein